MAAANKPKETTGTLKSNDVTLFFRHFGSGGGVPLLLHHGANYFDSADWIEVCRGLAQDREVVICDARGYANSTWSPSKDYSVDAAISDSLNVLKHFGWSKAVISGHSRGGGLAILMTAHHPEVVAGIVVIDRPLHKPVGRSHLQNGVPKVGQPHKIYPTLEDALADMGRDVPRPISEADRKRLLEFLKPVEGGYAITGQDPDRTNTVPTDMAGWRSAYDHPDLWNALGRVSAPCLIVRGTRSDRYSPEVLRRIDREFPHVRRADVPSGHDVAARAPEELVAAMRAFLKTDVDPKAGEVA